ncbi:uncharacterized protein LOC117496389 [Trematomus bernacchii]|uniref:uncharacterized protein LOC117496389 n=1 Tax=Trematomus bernacchii TaxID=40690 RepID=UPI00146DD0F2|nr:uncharacterized protein LOC117496389 [Trematomus bernacchii]
MYRGEIFAYPLYLQKKLASSMFFCMDVTCKYWPYLQRITKSCPELQHLLDMKPFLSVFHAKAHDFKCEVKWSGAYQEGAGLTLGEEVEQVNAFLSRIAVTTKHMSKAGRTDMLTLMAMRWNQQKVSNLATSLSRRYLKTTKALEKQLQNLESMKAELAVSEKQLEDWVRDVNEWAVSEKQLEDWVRDVNEWAVSEKQLEDWVRDVNELAVSEKQLEDWVRSTTNNPRDAAALASKIEMLTVSVKRRSQRLYKDTDSNKGRSRIRRKIRDEKGVLTATAEKYNSMVPSTEALCLEAILSVEKAWPWQLPNSDSFDLRTKRRAFDLVMAVKRLQEEKKILVTEMNHHWKLQLPRCPACILAMLSS